MTPRGTSLTSPVGVGTMGEAGKVNVEREGLGMMDAGVAGSGAVEVDEEACSGV